MSKPVRIKDDTHDKYIKYCKAKRFNVGGTADRAILELMEREPLKKGRKA